MTRCNICGWNNPVGAETCANCDTVLLHDIFISYSYDIGICMGRGTTGYISKADCESIRQYAQKKLPLQLGGMLVYMLKF